MLKLYILLHLKQLITLISLKPLITLITLIHIIHVMIPFTEFKVHSFSFSNSCSRWWRSTWSWWRWSAISVTNTYNTSCPCRVISITYSLCPSYASASHGTAPSGFYSLDCTWHGRIGSCWKNTRFWQALHAWWSASARGFFAWNLWCSSRWVENKCNRLSQKSQWSLCLSDTRHGVAGGGQEDLEHNY